jgi:dephospho-CoA kinase
VNAGAQELLTVRNPQRLRRAEDALARGEDLSIGLTGGLAAGKSTVAGWLREAGFLVIDADQLVADLYAPGEPGALAIEDLFGSGVLKESGAVDAIALASLIFEDPAARAAVEAAVHPLVAELWRVRTLLHQGVRVLEAALLVEADLAGDFDLVVTVEAGDENRLERAVARGLEPEAAQRRLSSQAKGSRRVAAADLVLHNDGTLSELRAKVDALVALLSPLGKPAEGKHSEGQS